MRTSSPTHYSKLQPIVKPIEKPSLQSKPISKLIPKPVSKPVSKPISKPVPKPISKPQHLPQTRSYYDEDLDQYEDDGFIVEDVDNCEELQMVIRQMVRPQGYNPELSISFFESVWDFNIYGEANESSSLQIDREEEYSRRCGENDDRNAVLFTVC